MTELPDDIKDKLVALAAQFVIDWNVERDAVVMLMMQVIEIYEELLKRSE